MNAIIHRYYEFSGSILANIFDDRMEIVSLGSLVSGLTMEDILCGISQSRNMSIANIFYRLQLIEGYGTGIQRILDTYQNAEMKPTMKANPSSFFVLLPKYQSMICAPQENSREEIVFRRLVETKRITRKDIEVLLGCSSFTANRAIHELLDKGQ